MRQKGLQVNLSLPSVPLCGWCFPLCAQPVSMDKNRCQANESQGRGALPHLCQSTASPLWLICRSPPHWPPRHAVGFDCSSASPAAALVKEHHSPQHEEPAGKIELVTAKLQTWPFFHLLLKSLMMFSSLVSVYPEKLHVKHFLSRLGICTSGNLALG